MKRDGEDYIRAHEDLIRQFLCRHPRSSEERAYLVTRSGVVEQMIRNHLKQQARERFLNSPVKQGEV